MSPPTEAGFIMTNRQAIWIAVGMAVGAVVWIVLRVSGVAHAGKLTATMIVGALFAWIATKLLRIN
jgi:hypothetical protein